MMDDRFGDFEKVRQGRMAEAWYAERHAGKILDVRDWMTHYDFILGLPGYSIDVKHTAHVQQSNQRLPPRLLLKDKGAGQQRADIYVQVIGWPEFEVFGWCWGRDLRWETRGLPVPAWGIGFDWLHRGDPVEDFYAYIWPDYARALTRGHVLAIRPV